MTAFLRRLDDLQRRHPWAGYPIAVVYKFIDDHSVFLAVLITYYGFLALFPVLLLLTSVLGYVLDDAPELREWILDTAVSQFPVIGPRISDEGFGGSPTALAIGAVVALWGAIRASQATLHVMNIAWAVPRHQRPDPLRSPLYALPLIAVAGLMLVGTTVATFLAATAGDFGVELRQVVPYLVQLLSFVVAVAVFSLGMWVGTSYPVTLRQVLPGALVAAVGWLLLQRFGITYANQVVARAGATYGAFAFVLGLVGFIFVAAQLVVLSVQVNVVRVKRLWPRALLGPFGRSVPLTPADVRTYRDTTAATAIKDYQEVDVRFEQSVAATEPEDDGAADSPAPQDPDAGPVDEEGTRPGD